MNWKSNIKILLVEDQSRGEFFQEYLEIKHGLNITRAIDIDEAWSLAIANEYNLFILDVMMPLNVDSILYEFQEKYPIKNEYGMFTGLLLLIKLRLERGPNNNFKILLFSARGREKVDEELKRLNVVSGYDAFVSKTADPIELYRTIETLLKDS